MRADKRSPDLNGHHINPGVKADERPTGENAAEHMRREQEPRLEVSLCVLMLQGSLSEWMTGKCGVSSLRPSHHLALLPDAARQKQCKTLALALLTRILLDLCLDVPNPKTRAFSPYT